MEIIKTKFLMGTDVEIIINSNLQEKEILDNIENSFNIFSDLEKEFSRFDFHSDLSKLNKNKILKVSDRFLKILNLCIEINLKTYNFFNPLINISNIGYSQNFNDSKFIKTDFKNNLNLEKIKIIGNEITLQEGQNLDFGGIVKGFAVDLVKEFLEKSGYNDFVINAGGDMFISKKSTIAIDDVNNNGDIFALLDLENISLSTSGTYKRKWEIDGKKFHHILNPKKNENNNEILSISIIGKDCYITDSFATACIAMGIEKAKNFLEKQNLEAIIILENGKYELVGDLNKYSFEII